MPYQNCSMSSTCSQARTWWQRLRPDFTVPQHQFGVAVVVESREDELAIKVRMKLTTCHCPLSSAQAIITFLG